MGRGDEQFNRGVKRKNALGGKRKGKRIALWASEVNWSEKDVHRKKKCARKRKTITI